MGERRGQVPTTEQTEGPSDNEPTLLADDGRGGGKVSPEARAADDSARLDWYRRAIADDPERRERFARNLERVRTTPGTPDDLEAVAKLLTAE